ncbi:hypothetical protein ACH5RR_040496 [Cinchona calisaya]|uniref:Uncharacterized protein n=1 Tax=Cinchona calisaya TaxID=153742 RepID=A0ABD2XX32_9GENT
MQGLKRSKMLAKGEVDLCVGNGANVAALAVGTYYLFLPSDIVLELKNCYDILSLIRNIISIPCLDTDDFVIMQKNKCCSFSCDGIVYGIAILNNGLYILNMKNSVFNINTERSKIDNLK